MITGIDIRMRAIERSDLPRFVRWLNDPEVTAGLSLILPISMDEEEAWYEAMLKQPATQHPMMIEVCQSEEWAPVGNCGYHDINTQVRSGEVGIFIGEKHYWNKGYGTEAMRLLVRHGFETLNLNRVFLRVYANNPRAIRSYEKVGFVHEGRLRQAAYRNGQYVDELIMSILRTEWEAARNDG